MAHFLSVTNFGVFQLGPCTTLLQAVGKCREVIKGHLTEDIVHEAEEAKREKHSGIVLKVLDCWVK